MFVSVAVCLRGLTFTWWGYYGLCLWHKPTELAHSFLFCSCVCFCLHGSFNCVSFHKFPRQLFAFPLCSSCFISALLVPSTIYLFVKVSLSPDIILCGWLGVKHQLTDWITVAVSLSYKYVVTAVSQSYEHKYVFVPFSQSCEHKYVLINVSLALM